MMRVYLLIFLFCVECFPDAFGGKLPKTAIVGGGISGTSSAFFLTQLLGRSEAIDLYEPNAIGGRLATVKINGEEFEIGGSILHARNKYMSHFADLFHLNRRTLDNELKLGIYTGEFVFTGSSVNWYTLIKLLWRYGIGILYLNSKINKLLSEFERIYEIQQDGEAFDNVKDLLHAMNADFPNYMNITTYNGFLADGISEAIINELIQSSIRCNYGQSTTVHKFVGAVSVAGAGSELWAVEGGNKEVPEKLLEASHANLHPEKVLKIKLTKSNQYIVSTNKANRTYDVVILATPLTEDHQQIQFENFEEDIHVPGKYHHTVCTIILGTINSTFFGFKHPDEVPNAILTANENLFFNSLSQIFPTKQTREEEINGDSVKVWKIFSQRFLLESELKSLFAEYKVILSKDWLAYPEYSAENRVDNFALYENLYYVNAIEWAASAMEMSVVGSKNVALLIYNKWVYDEDLETKSEIKREEL